LKEKDCLMKKALALSGVLIMLFAGCSTKNPEIGQETNTSEQTTQPAAEMPTEVVTESVVVEEEPVAPAAPSMADLEAKLGTIYFAFDKYDITMPSVSALTFNADVINTASFNVKIEGNCDEWGSDEYNFALGLKRAKAAKDVLVSKGVDASRISMVSYGESNPVCTEHTKECWAKNRRDDFKLLP